MDEAQRMKIEGYKKEVKPYFDTLMDINARKVPSVIVDPKTGHCEFVEEELPVERELRNTIEDIFKKHFSK